MIVMKEEIKAQHVIGAKEENKVGSGVVANKGDEARHMIAAKDGEQGPSHDSGDLKIYATQFFALRCKYLGILNIAENLERGYF